MDIPVKNHIKSKTIGPSNTALNDDLPTIKIITNFSRFHSNDLCEPSIPARSIFGALPQSDQNIHLTIELASTVHRGGILLCYSFRFSGCWNTDNLVEQLTSYEVTSDPFPGWRAMALGSSRLSDTKVARWLPWAYQPFGYTRKKTMIIVKQG